MNNSLKASPLVKYTTPDTKEQNQFIPSRFVKSSLFSETFVLRDIDKELAVYWSNEETSGFMEFWTHLCLFAKDFNEFGEAKYSWNYEETLNKLVHPILEILGHGEIGNIGLDHFLGHEEFEVPTLNGLKKKIKIPLLITKSASDKNEIIKNKNNLNILSELRKKSALPITVEYFDSWGDQKIKQYDFSKAISSDLKDEYSYLDKELQCAEYLNLLDKDFGIATDGARWRIINKTKTKEDSSLFYEFDLLTFLELLGGVNADSNIQNETSLKCAKWFYWFFSKEGMYGSSLNFLSEVELRSIKYAEHIEEDLKARFVFAVTLAVNGYINSFHKKSIGPLDLDLIISTSESFIFNLFFLRSCESKGIIPFHHNYKQESLANLVSKIEFYNPLLSWNENSLSISGLKFIYKKELNPDGVEIYDHLHRLFETIKNGDKGFRIDGFIETVFESAEYDFYRKNKLTNRVIIGLVHELMFFKNDNKVQEIPYSTFSPRQLGSIYESFLEYKPTLVKMDHYYLRKITKKNGKNLTTWSWENKNEVTKKLAIDGYYKVKKGEYIFAPNDEDKKDSGAFYTPHYVVESMVRSTLGSLTSRLLNPHEILDLKVCDPAMGSAHFLVEALNFLYKEYLRICGEGSRDFDIKKKILSNCIYGVDINSRAVKLAKMSLWLSTALPGSLEHLNDQLKLGDSLDDKSFNWKKEFGFFEKKGGFNVIIGNPPYITYSLGKKSKKVNNTYIDYLKSKYQNSVSYKVNSYAVFYERSLELLAMDGCCAYIVPGTILINDSNTLLRKYFITNFHINKVCNLKYKVFKDAEMGDCAIIDIKKAFTVRGMNYDIAFEEMTSENWEVNFNSKNIKASDVLLDDYVKFVPGESEHFRLDRYLGSKSLYPRIGDENIAKFYNGIKTGDNKKFLSDVKKNGKYIPVVRGRDFSKYSKVKSGMFVLFDKELLWSNTDEKKLGVKKKILVRQTGDTLTCTLDSQGNYPMDTVHMIYESSYDLHFLLGTLNSSFMDFVHSHIAPEKGKAFAEVKISNLKKLPFPVVDFKNSNHLKIYEDVIRLVKEILKEGYNVSLQNKINNYIFELFEVDENESNYIRECELKKEESKAA